MDDLALFIRVKLAEKGRKRKPPPLGAGAKVEKHPSPGLRAPLCRLAAKPPLRSGLAARRQRGALHTNQAISASQQHFSTFAPALSTFALAATVFYRKAKNSNRKTTTEKAKLALASKDELAGKERKHYITAMSVAEIIEELPKLSHAEQREIALRLREVMEDDRDAALADARREEKTVSWEDLKREVGL